jgi:hypothetical protein
VGESKHHPEPWSNESGDLCDATGHVLAFDYEMEKSERVRAAACVNACAGIPTEALEAGVLRKALDLLKFGSIDESDPCQGDEPGCPECEAVNVLCALGRLP